MAGNHTEIIRLAHGDPGPDPIHVGIVCPNSYGVAVASLGYQLIHSLASNVDGIITHRVVIDTMDQKTYPTKTYEEGLDIRSLDMLLVSCSFEFDYLHFLRILNACGIQPLRRKRGSLPLIIVGGNAPTGNPEPIASYADAVAIGESEELLPQMLEDFKDYYPLLTSSRFQKGRTALYEEWRHIPGVYVPAFWEDKDGRFAHHDGNKIQQASIDVLDNFESYTPVVSVDGAYGPKNLVEIGRGCATRCRFCMISYIAAPGRWRSEESVLDNAHAFKPGEASVGLVSSSVSDHPAILPIINSLADEHYQVSVSSLKVKGTKKELIEALAKSGTRSATFAPEHGSESIRALICKDVTYDDTLSRIRWCFESGIAKIKLYFITGFAEEMEEDLWATSDFIKSLANDISLYSRPQAFQFTIGLAPFVPKPSTPFQRRAMDSEATLRQKMKQILMNLKRLPRMEFETESPREALMQGAISQGDRSLEPYFLFIAGSRGSILSAWDEAIATLGDGPVKKVTKERQSDHALPWAFIKRTELVPST